MLKIGLASESNQVDSLKKKESHSTETLNLGQEDPVSHLTGDWKCALKEWNTTSCFPGYLLMATEGDKVLGYKEVLVSPVLCVAQRNWILSLPLLQDFQIVK